MLDILERTSINGRARQERREGDSKEKTHAEIVILEEGCEVGRLRGAVSI
jgi:hypothetical protein